NLIFVFAFLFVQCNRAYTPQEVSGQNMYLSDTLAVDSVMLAFIEPYKNTIHERMDFGLVKTNIDLVNKRPEGSLGNFVADALLNQAKKLHGKNIDLAFTNTSGLRLEKIPVGNIKLGQIYELIPFDNKVVVA